MPLVDGDVIRGLEHQLATARAHAQARRAHRDHRRARLSERFMSAPPPLLWKCGQFPRFAKRAMEAMALKLWWEKASVTSQVYKHRPPESYQSRATLHLRTMRIKRQRMAMSELRARVLALCLRSS